MELKVGAQQTFRICAGHNTGPKMLVVALPFFQSHFRPAKNVIKW